MARNRFRMKVRPKVAISDNYCIFSPSFLAKLFDLHKWHAIPFFFPIVMVTTAIESSSFDVATRILFLNTAYLMIKLLENQSKNIYKSSSRSKDNFSRYLSNNQSMRIKHTILALAHSLKYYSQNIKMNRLGTHLIEFMFGNMRRLSYNNDSAEVLQRAILKSQIAKEICAKWGINTHIHGRIDFGGSRNDENWNYHLRINIFTLLIDLPNEMLDMLTKKLPDVEVIPLGKGGRLKFRKRVNYKKEFYITDFIITQMEALAIQNDRLHGPISGQKIYMRNVIYSNN